MRSVIVVLPGREAVFLGPLPVEALPEVGEQTRRALLQLGVRTIGQLLDVPEGVLANALGARGRTLYRQLHGLAVPQRIAARHELTQQLRFTPEPCRDVRQLQTTTYLLVERIGRQLRQQQVAAGRLTLAIGWVDGRTRSATTALVPRCDLDRELGDHAQAALIEVLEARRVAVERVEVTVSEFGPHQASLLTLDERSRDLQHAVDVIKTRHGTGAILTGPLVALADRLKRSA